MAKGTYELLDAQSANAYISSKPHLAELVDVDTLEMREVGDGNLNLVFVGTDADGRGICLKQSLPYVRLVGEAWPLTPERVAAEARGLGTAAQVAAEMVPRFYGLDEERNILAMENLAGWGMWRDRMNHGEAFHGVPEMLGRFVAKMTMATSLFGLDQLTVKERQAGAINPELCKITEDLVFTEPYVDHPNNSFTDGLAPDVAALRADDELRAAVGALKFRFMTSAEALVHGDLHSGSVMVRHTGEVRDGLGDGEGRVIDSEFCYYGPVAFDLGALFGNYLCARVRAAVLGRSEAFQRWTAGMIAETWASFAAELRRGWAAVDDPMFTARFLERWIAEVGRDALGFGGCKAIRRIIGLAKVTDIETLPAEHHDRAARLVLNVARRWILEAEHIGDPAAAMAVFDEEWAR